MLLRKILGSLRRVDEAYGLIANGDKIAVGLSGGKDSMLLLYCLSLYQRFSQKSFSIIGISIDIGFDNEIEKALQYFSSMGVTILIEKTRIKNILELHKLHDHLDCSLCSNLKKGALVKVSKESGCNKIALGHNADDAVETLFLNQIYGGKIATFQPVQYLSRDNVSLIRPFIYAYESEIATVCEQIGLPIIPSNCPQDGVSKRQDIKIMLSKLYKEYPQARKNFLKMLSNQQQMALWEEKDK